MNPFQIGAWAGAGLVGVASGAAKSAIETIDFAGLLQSDSASSPAESNSAAEGSSTFVGINDQHKAIAEMRTRLADALATLEQLLQSAGADDQLELSQDEDGSWLVSGAGDQRVALEQALGSSPEWNAAFNELIGAADSLQALGADPATVPGWNDRRGDDEANTAFELSDLRLERRDGGLTASVG